MSAFVLTFLFFPHLISSNPMLVDELKAEKAILEDFILKLAFIMVYNSIEVMWK